MTEPITITAGDPSTHGVNYLLDVHFKEPPVDKNCLTYWWPMLQQINDKIVLPREEKILLPKTELVDAGEDWFTMVDLSDPTQETNVDSDKKIQDVADRLMMASCRIGDPPFFLRTGHFSGKHDWDKTCFIPDRSAKTFYEHVRAIVNMSMAYGMFGELPCRHWVIREYLPVIPTLRLKAYGNMPFVPEIRAFTKGGKVRGYQPYWPKDSIEKGQPSIAGLWDEAYHQSNIICERAWIDDHSGVKKVIQRVAEGIPGDWSVDMLFTNRGWYLTDMAEASRSHFDKESFKFESGMD